MRDPDPPAQQLPQLRMEIAGLAASPSTIVPPVVPPGYGLRTFRPGDEEAWVGLLQLGEFGHWDCERLDLMLAGERARVPRAGVFFVTADERPVGTACTLLHPGPDGLAAELGWVVVEPEQRGHGLGLVICRAVLDFIGQLGYDRAFLLTDDFRLPAIQTYLTLGFAPAIVYPSHPSRWAAIHRQLAAHRPHAS